MESSEIDKIIADAVADSKRQSKWHRSTSKGGNVLKVRNYLNWTFMIGFLFALIVYFVFPEHKTLFFCLGFGSMILKLIEFYLRFVF